MTAEGRPAALRFLPDLLFRAERPLSYWLAAWALALLPSLALSWLVSTALPDQGPQFPKMDPVTTLFLLVVFAPVVETLIMGAVLLVLDRFFGFATTVFLSAAGWGLAHSLQAPAWGLVIWWPFLIFSVAFLVWRRRRLWMGFAMASAIHGLQNLGPAILLMTGISA